MKNTQRKMGPLPPDYMAVRDQDKCPGCHKIFAAGDYVTLIVTGPGDDLEARALSRAGQTFNGVAMLAHWGCVTGKLDNED